MLRRFGLTAASLFLAYQSVRLVVAVRTGGALPVGLEVFLALLFNLFVLGAFAFAGFAWPTWRLLPGAYYRVRDARALATWSRRLGLEGYRTVLLATVWRSRRQRDRHFTGRRADLGRLAEQSRSAEFGHLVPMVLLLGVSAWTALRGEWVLAAVTLALNVFANAYPVLLQRHHRMRLDRLRAYTSRRAGTLGVGPTDRP